MTYLDTSALIKRFVSEIGSQAVQTLLAGAEPAATAKIAYAEVYAALTRRYQRRDLSPHAYTQACRQFEQDWQGFIRVDLHDDILFLARRLIQKYVLRGFDAIHLASALHLKLSLLEETVFVVADAALLKAASAERLKVINPEAA